jgi:hypothetical protein
MKDSDGQGGGPRPQFPPWLPGCQALTRWKYTVGILRQTNQKRSKAIKIPLFFH